MVSLFNQFNENIAPDSMYFVSKSFVIGDDLGFMEK